MSAEKKNAAKLRAYTGAAAKVCRCMVSGRRCCQVNARRLKVTGLTLRQVRGFYLCKIPLLRRRTGGKTPLPDPGENGAHHQHAAVFSDAPSLTHRRTTLPYAAAPAEKLRCLIRVKTEHIISTLLSFLTPLF